MTNYNKEARSQKPELRIPSPFQTRETTKKKNYNLYMLNFFGCVGFSGEPIAVSRQRKNSVCSVFNNFMVDK